MVETPKAAIEVENLRVSWIWVETNLCLLGDKPPEHAPLPFLGRPPDYKEKFQELIRQAGGVPDALSVPWRPGTRGRTYWTYYYLKGRKLVDGGSDAWRYLVPMRRALPIRPEAAWLPGRLRFEAFYYPHGFALIATAHIESAKSKDPITLDRACELAIELDDAGVLTLPAEKGSAKPWTGTLQDLASVTLDRLSEEIYGPQAPPGVRPVAPFHVATLVGANVGQASIDPDQDVDLKRRIYALASLSDTYLKVNPPIPMEGIPIGRVPLAHHALYATSRGRAAWFPAYFSDRDSGGRKLGCYHRNLVLNSLQIESLGGLVANAAGLLGGTMPDYVRGAAKLAAGALVNCYLGKPNVAGIPQAYRSRSSERQIIENGLIDPLNQLAAHFHFEELKEQPRVPAGAVGTPPQG